MSFMYLSNVRKLQYPVPRVSRMIFSTKTTTVNSFLTQQNNSMGRSVITYSTMPSSINPYTSDNTNFEDEFVMLPQTSVCPPNVSRDLFNDLCRIAAIDWCIKNFIPKESWIPLAQLLYTSGGRGITLTQKLISSDTVQSSDVTVDFTKMLHEDILLTLPEHLVTALSKISLRCQSMLVYEIWAQVLVNKNLIHNRLGFIYDTNFTDGSVCNFHPEDDFNYEKNLQSWSNYYNNTPNTNADYVLVLDKPISINGEPKNLIAYDLKFSKGTVSQNIVQACISERQLISELLRRHQAMISSLKTSAATFSSIDTLKARQLKKELETNLASFTTSGDTDRFLSTYNRMQETYSTFLFQNKMGFNFVVKMSLDDLVVNKTHRTQFSAKFREYFSSQGTSVSHFANTVAKKNAGTMDTQSLLNVFIHKILQK